MLFCAIINEPAMVRYVFTVIAAFCICSAAAQKSDFTPPHYKKIGKAILKKESPTYYPDLMVRYKAHDTTLSPYEYHLLYFGYALQADYEPYAHQPFADSLMAIVRKTRISPDDYDLVIKYTGRILDKNPFDMRYLDPLIYVYRMQGKNDLATSLEFKLGRIIETIFTTGDGLTEKTAFHVISVSHEYDLLRALGFGYAGEQSLSRGQCDFLKVETNDFGINGMYFNVSALIKPGGN
ncbi:MAG: DUF4919 domain-containing protein [Bacteroidota bacterium]